MPEQAWLLASRGGDPAELSAPTAAIQAIQVLMGDAMGIISPTNHL